MKPHKKGLPFSLTLIIVGLLAMAIASCGGSAKEEDEESAVNAQTPVTVTAIDSGDLTDSITLNATSSFLQKSYIKANTIGYIQRVYVQPGAYVNKGQLLFTIKTKEAQSIGNTINVLDTTFRFSGINRIKSSKSGFVTELAHQVGDYVQDGDQIAVISDRESFAFLLQLPYELRSVLANNKSILLTMPDGEKLNGRVASILPAVDSLSQTQGVVIKVNSSHPIPENLVAKARLVKTARTATASFPKSAVLANETQTEFWVMKLINDTTAVKVPVKRGIESGGRTEILSPKFTGTDRIVVTGNYGLADTAKVKIVKQ